MTRSSTLRRTTQCSLSWVCLLLLGQRSGCFSSTVLKIWVSSSLFSSRSAALGGQLWTRWESCTIGWLYVLKRCGWFIGAVWAVKSRSASAFAVRPAVTPKDQWQLSKVQIFQWHHFLEYFQRCLCESACLKLYFHLFTHFYGGRRHSRRTLWRTGLTLKELMAALMIQQ